MMYITIALRCYSYECGIHLTRKQSLVHKLYRPTIFHRRINGSYSKAPVNSIHSPIPSTRHNLHYVAKIHIIIQLDGQAKDIFKNVVI